MRSAVFLGLVLIAVSDKEADAMLPSAYLILVVLFFMYLTMDVVEFLR